MKTKEEVIDYINSLDGYEGYVQFSHRPISKDTDIFLNGNVEVTHKEKGFIYEAHFYNEAEKKSIQIRQVNNNWLVSSIELTNKKFDISYQEYISDIREFNYKVKMAQVWKIEEDELCQNMEVKKLEKVVFAGFVKGDLK